tara:strand:+ start:1081 stop:2199 length:1119 start_codon:yes stop_codon:yes gene_type:complete
MFSKSIATKGGDVFRDEFSVAFDGSNDYVDCGSDSSLDVGTNDFSVSAWCKVSTKGGSDYHDIVAKGNTLASGDGWGIALVESNKTIYLDTNGDVGRQNAISPTSSWEFGKWYHIVGTRSNSANTLKLYLNGVLVATNASATNDDLGDASINFKIGTSESGRETKGNISEVAYYNSVLTINQVKTIYNGREPYNHKEGVASGNLQAWYRMGDGTLDNFAAICDETNATLGSDMVTNGTFAADSDWTKGTGWSIGSGVATASSLGSSNLSQDISAVTGKIYQVTFDLTSYTSGALFLDIAGSQNYAYVAAAPGESTGSKKAFIKATSSDLIFYSMGVGLNFTGSIDNVKVKQVGDNAGLMTNMSADDIEGDTP